MNTERPEEPTLPSVGAPDDVEDASELKEPTLARAAPDRDQSIKREMSVRTRRGFITGGVAALAGIGAWHWLGTRRELDGIPWPLRLSHEFNEELSRDYFKPSRMAPTFSTSMAREVRINGLEGMDDGFDPATWKLAVMGLANPPELAHSSQPQSAPKSGDDVEDDDDDDDDDQGSGDVKNGSDSDASDDEGSEPALMLTLADIKSLPRVDMVTRHKCIEGWSTIVHWTGARFADFIAKYPPATRSGNDPDVANNPGDLVPYVSLETPGAGYYVGLEMESALHPQTLLCYEMNGQPLTLQHGAPLRLVVPLKYGIKSIKRIGTITFTERRPADYWAERGYDWYSGH